MVGETDVELASGNGRLYAHAGRDVFALPGVAPLVHAVVRYRCRELCLAIAFERFESFLRIDVELGELGVGSLHLIDEARDVALREDAREGVGLAVGKPLGVPSAFVLVHLVLHLPHRTGRTLCPSGFP